MDESEAPNSEVQLEKHIELPLLFLYKERRKMALTVYADRIVNGIDFEEVGIEINKRQQLTLEFQEINSMMRVPAIVDGRLKLFESHAIMIYLACAFPGIADHCGAGLCTDICCLSMSYHDSVAIVLSGYVLNSTHGPALGLPLNPEAAAKSEKLLSASLAKIESFWLKGSGRFLLGSTQPSIADLSLVCEIMQLELVDEKDRERILGPHKGVMEWIDDTKNATRPHFDEVHSVLFKVKQKLQSQRAVAETGKNVLPSKI
ncbi:hypothetical protein SASPL_140790 [Salvia splendens]|uniref:GST N-terminal domain-containing protein n=1 Tax=Salvia splendens TaxID=180675 RepID=A0A8X8ZCT6_SALSN|nr:hypothetical protein SASPL_140790 [Salvia splendens]